MVIYHITYKPYKAQKYASPQDVQEIQTPNAYTKKQAYY